MNGKQVAIIRIVTVGIFISLTLAISDNKADNKVVCPISTTPGNIECVVTKVIDGDTVHATCSGKDTKIRLTNIDSYESKKNNRAFKQAYQEKITIDDVIIKGKKAAAITKKELTGKNIIVVVATGKGNKDPYGRTLGEIYLNCVDINQKLLIEHSDVFLQYK